MNAQVTQASSLAQKVTVIINNRDLLEWPQKMVAKIERLHNVHDIIIIDNGSTYRPLLAWYKSIPYQVIFLENEGHKAPWTSGIIDTIATDYYVVTDPDLDIDDLPDDCLDHLRRILESSPALEKVGLSLVTEGVSEQSPYFSHVAKYSEHLSSLPTIDDLYIPAPIDTTFALYDRRILPTYKITGVSTLAPYQAKHLPWYVVNPEGEFKYYLDRASTSSSYVWFTQYQKTSTIQQYYDEHVTGKVSTKWTSYFAVYDKVLHERKDDAITMLEIGVQNGGSLDIWGKYFHNAKKIIGCDINPLCSTLVYDNPAISVVVGDANSSGAYQAITQQAKGLFDIIIDDGSHHSDHVITSFINYFPLLKAGGVYIVEDMHCAYWPEYGGGYFNHRSAAAFFRQMFDLVNVEHCRKEFSAHQLFHTFFHPLQLPECLSDGSIYSISSYNSIYVIEKSVPGKKMPILGEWYRVGDDNHVETRV